MKKVTALISVFLVSFGIISSCHKGGNPSGGKIPPDSDINGIDFAASYSDLYKALSVANNSYYWPSGGSAMNGLFFDAEMADSAPMASAPQSGSDSMTKSMDGGYSETNVQVAGIDEGDIVKTNGKHIFILRGGNLIVVLPDGDETSVLSDTKVCDTKYTSEERGAYDDKNYRYISFYETPYELYIFDDYVAVTSYYNHYSNYMADGIRKHEEASITKLYIYDVSNPTSPALLHELGQDGSYLTSRLVGGTLYLLSTHYVYDPVEGDADTFVPALYRDAERCLIEPECIAIMPNISSRSYTVISAFDIESGETIANQTVLGNGGTVYMNHDNLYLAGYNYAYSESTPYKKGIYSVVDYTSESTTDITRFDISDGGITFSASASVPGSLMDQFAIDEYNGYLRLVMNVSRESWSVYLDADFGWENYDWGENYTANSLYILDQTLNMVGSIEGLAKDEYLYSARLEGDIGYFVTFRQVDPLFAVDLSDPTAPKILSELKIPGFSEYLHPYLEGRLFGLGMDANAETGRTNGMKMSMFDTSDPTDVTEKHVLKLDSYYSAAMYNHRAILISAEKDIIAFPDDTGYTVYGYSDERGFYKKAHVDSGGWNDNARGLYIGNTAYIISDSLITVIDMVSFERIAAVKF